MPSVQKMRLAVIMALLSAANAARSEEANYDESKVPSYNLPDPLVLQDGTKVTTPQQWREVRRPELLEIFRTQVYGRRLEKPQGLTFTEIESDPKALGGKGTKKKIRIDFFGKGAEGPGTILTLFIPNDVSGPVPAFLGMRLFDADAAEPIPGKVLEESVDIPLPGKNALAEILGRGYAIGTLHPEDFCPDNPKTFREGVLTYVHPEKSGPPKAEEPGCIAVWAWALSRALDYLETDPAIDASNVAVVGHSRMGKTALWAGAEDPRFAIVISNNSGCAGAALSRRRYGETIERIKRVFPNWFCGNFSKYADKEDSLPIDQHELIALAAPRPVYVASAVGDRWADPKGEFLAAAAAEPVYELLGKPGLFTGWQKDLDADETTPPLPPLNQSVGENIGFHLRVGGHALSDFDWVKYLDFADRHIK